MLNVSALIFRIVGNITEHSTKVFTDIAVKQKTIQTEELGSFHRPISLAFPFSIDLRSFISHFHFHSVLLLYTIRLIYWRCLDPSKEYTELRDRGWGGWEGGGVGRCEMLSCVYKIGGANKILIAWESTRIMGQLVLKCFLLYFSDNSTTGGCVKPKIL